MTLGPSQGRVSFPNEGWQVHLDAVSHDFASRLNVW